MKPAFTSRFLGSPEAEVYMVNVGVRQSEAAGPCKVQVVFIVLEVVYHALDGAVIVHRWERCKAYILQVHIFIIYFPMYLKIKKASELIHKYINKIYI